ncbi:hypothetical protein HanIR_Chr13g0646471 [Helianthus annuus]|nr:hypothetical protein HanIR_Chr13g0646471 [Helianthus annuus]
MILLGEIRLTRMHVWRGTLLACGGAFWREQVCTCLALLWQTKACSRGRSCSRMKAWSCDVTVPAHKGLLTRRDRIRA